MTLTLRPIDATEYETFLTTGERAFGSDLHPDDAAREDLVFERERSLAAFDGKDIVATAGAFSLSMTVPGGPRPVAGVTFVGVLPTHRRQGILTALMQRQFEDLHDVAEPVAALWASEASIYGRFGYGVASHFYGVEIRRGDGALARHAPIADVDMRLDFPDDVRDALTAVHEKVVRDRVGDFVRDERWWSFRLADAEHRRGPWARRLAVVAFDKTGEPQGYALYRRRPSFSTDDLPDGEVGVDEIVAVSPPVHLAIWRYLLGIDLTTTWRGRIAVDDPLLWQLADTRRCRAVLRDNLWVRIIDVDRALAARAYTSPVDVVLEVTDDRCRWNAGRWRLSADPTGATCSRTTDTPDLRLYAPALASAYLGSVSLNTLASAGLVTAERPGALAAAATAFSWPTAAYCPMTF